MAFTKEDEINMKYNVAVNQIQKPKAESKKRPYQEVSRANPFKKEEAAVTPQVEAPIVEETPSAPVAPLMEDATP